VKQALIIFARLPRPGEVKTRLGKEVGMAEASEIYREFAQHVFSIGDQLAATGTRIYLFYDAVAKEQDIRAWIRHLFVFAPQSEESLGERMQRAFDKAFMEGAGRSVIIGTDVPELEASTVLNAFDRLSSHDVVIGPSTDGGYYLLGMNRPTKEIFKGIKWSTDSVYRESIKRLDSLSLSYSVLPELADIDTKEDYARYLRRQRST
jgi:rSAM/selenodomain-associated transferase 1